MRFIYDILIDDAVAISCSSFRVAKNMIKELSEHYKESSFGIYNSDTGIIINAVTKENYKMKKQELFEKTVKSMDNYTKSIEMELFDFENYYHEKMREYLSEIKQRGLEDEFSEYALVF